MRGVFKNLPQWPGQRSPPGNKFLSIGAVGPPSLQGPSDHIVPGLAAAAHQLLNPLPEAAGTKTGKVTAVKDMSKWTNINNP